eukprot:3009683-Prymnesium_polylepis.1
MCIRDRQLSASTTYWICAFANNQHDPSELAEPDLMQTPFVRAIMADGCMGTVMLMDEATTPFARSWCILEAYVSVTDGAMKPTPHLFDIATIIPAGAQARFATGPLPAGAALLLDQGSASGNSSRWTERTEVPRAWFPAQVARSGSRTDVLRASSTRLEDTANIRRLITGCEGAERPPEQHAAYAQVNCTLRRMFAEPALHDFAKEGESSEVARLLAEAPHSVDAVNEQGESVVRLPHAPPT